MEAVSNTMDMTRGHLEAKTEGTAAHSAAKASSAKAPVGDMIIKARTMSMPDVQARALADSGFMRSPPNGVRLSCGAVLRFSQIKDYNKKQAPTASGAC
jgi:hypothetical protein